MLVDANVGRSLFEFGFEARARHPLSHQADVVGSDDDDGITVTNGRNSDVEVNFAASDRSPPPGQPDGVDADDDHPTTETENHPEGVLHHDF